MATNRKKFAKMFPLLVLNLCGGSIFSKIDKNLEPVPAVNPIASWEGQSGLQLQGQLTHSNIAIREMVDKNITTYGHLYVKDFKDF